MRMLLRVVNWMIERLTASYDELERSEALDWKTRERAAEKRGGGVDRLGFSRLQ